MTVTNLALALSDGYHRRVLLIDADLRRPSIHDVLGAPMFVMSRSFLRETARPDDIRDALVEIAARSDHVEKLLTRLDQY